MKVKFMSPKGMRETRNFSIWEAEGYWLEDDGKTWIPDEDFEKSTSRTLTNCRVCKTLKAFKRQVRKSNLPKGTVCRLRHCMYRHGYKNKSCSLDVITTKE